jgi:hypothetical protein
MTRRPCGQKEQGIYLWPLFLPVVLEVKDTQKKKKKKKF